MPRAPRHYRCPAGFGNFFKTLYIRQTEPARWIPVGKICDGCKATQIKLPALK